MASLSILPSGLYVKSDNFYANRNHKVYNFKKANFHTSFACKLGFVVDNISDVNFVVESFYNVFYEILDVHIPVVKNFKHTYSYN